MDMLANTLLIKHFLLAQRIQVPENRIDEQIEQVRQQLKKQGQDLETALNQSGSSLEEMRKDIANTLRFDEFVRSRATDPGAAAIPQREPRPLRPHSGARTATSCCAVHPDATKEQKEKIKQKLEQIRQEIVGGKTTFAAAANKYSEDPANAGGAGGDLDYFTLDMGFVEEFADAAFKMKKGEISQPVETPYGYHLIQVTDRKEGKVPDFEQFRINLAQYYRMKLQKDIVEDERKTAKIDIQPMPKDLFPSEPPVAARAPSATTPAAGTAGAPAAPKP